MRSKRSLVQTTPVIAAARRRARGQAVIRRGEGGTAKPKNNFVAETGSSPGKLWGNRKGAGPGFGNLNAVHLPHRTPDQIALYRRIAFFQKRSKSLVASGRSVLRQRAAALRATREEQHAT